MNSIINLILNKNFIVSSGRFGAQVRRKQSQKSGEESPSGSDVKSPSGLGRSSSVYSNQTQPPPAYSAAESSSAAASKRPPPPPPIKPKPKMGVTYVTALYDFDPQVSCSITKSKK